MSEQKTVFETLSALDMSEHYKKKGNITYLPWSKAWEAVKKLYPSAHHEIVKTPEGCLYWTDGKTCWVETSVTIEGETQNETLAVMNHVNKSIAADEVTSTEFEKSIKRCLVKNLALFGLALNLWYGEELSAAAKETKKQKEAEEAAAEAERKKAEAALTAENNKILELCKEYKEAGVDSETMFAIIGKYADGKRNPNAIKTMEDSAACLKEIKALKKPTKKEDK